MTVLGIDARIRLRATGGPWSLIVTLPVDCYVVFLSVLVLYITVYRRECEQDIRDETLPPRSKE